MTRKDYVAIAAAINATRGHPVYRDSVQIDFDTRSGYVAGRIADVLAADNPRFDRARFLKACGVLA